MYVRLKHGLCALALDAIARPEDPEVRARLDWLLAFCDLMVERGPDRPEPVAEVARRAGRGEPDAGLAWIVERGILAQHDLTLVLPEGVRPHAGYLERQVRRLDVVMRRLPADPPPGVAPEAVRRGAALFNGGLFFACHEYFEGLWRRAPAEDRAFYQGIILIAAGFYHFEKGNRHGARAKLTAGIGKLASYAPAFLGVDVAGWLTRLGPWKADVDARRAGRPLEAQEIPPVPLAGVGA